MRAIGQRPPKSPVAERVDTGGYPAPEWRSALAVPFQGDHERAANARSGGAAAVCILSCAGLAATEARGAVEIRVSDRGPGMPDSAKLFRAFSRGTSGSDGPAGLGLGLALSRSLARAMGGDQLDEVPEPVFVRPSVTVPLSVDERQALRRIAASRGVDEAILVHDWVREKLSR